MDQGTPLTYSQRRIIRWWITRQSRQPHMTLEQLHKAVQECYSGRWTRTYAHAYAEALMTANALEWEATRDKRS